MMIYVAAPLIACGMAIVVRSLFFSTNTRRPTKDPERALSLVQSFRIGIIGLCLAGVGFGLWFDLKSVLWLALIIGGEELLESTVIITALRHSPQATSLSVGEAT